MKNLIERWIDENLTDIRVFEDYPDPTDSQLNDLVKFLLAEDSDFLLSALTCQGEMDQYEKILIEHAERPTIKSSKQLSKYVSRCLKAHAAYLLDQNGDYFAGSLRNYSREYAREQYMDYLSEQQNVLLGPTDLGAI